MTSISSLTSSSASTYRLSLDKNGDGVVSADELAAANTAASSSASTSSSLLSTSDDTDAGTDPAARLSSMIMSLLLQMSGGAPSDGSQDAGSDGDRPAPPTISDLDTDGDGVVSASEFAASKPDDVTDDMSANLFSQLDADGNGSIDATEFQAMRNSPPPPSPGGADPAATETASEDLPTSLNDLLEQIQSFAKQYLDEFSDSETSVSVASL